MQKVAMPRLPHSIEPVESFDQPEPTSHSLPSRTTALSVCLAEGCSTHRRLEDGIFSPAGATEVLTWTLDAPRPLTLDRRLAGRRLGGLGWVVQRTEDPDLVRKVYRKLRPVLDHYGSCDRGASLPVLCGRCLHRSGPCRFV